MGKIIDLMEASRRETGVREHTPPGYDEPTFRQAKRPAAAGVIRLSDVLPEYSIDITSPIAAVVEHKAGQKAPLSTAIMANSRIVQAGARLVPVSEKLEPLRTERTGLVAWQSRAKRFSIIDGAKFAAVDDGDNVITSELPIQSVDISLGDAPSHGLRFEIDRSVLKRDGDAAVEIAVMTGLTLGLANLADAVLLNAIKDSEPEAFTLGAAASRGVRIGELRAFVGTAGAGATLEPHGILLAGGIPAELTGGIDATIIGSFARAGVAMNDEVMVIVDRLSVTGRMAVSAWVNCQALLPDSSAFWTVSA